ncbi:family 5 extracellular solute-binding protein [Halosimplex carlsbadense 2-9-1]|uniref:Family 5 extracellular solute-binding protein n=1 Tax=Halosimplex carlsbadense 2-9-1 TaxID=797114 RepID=M0C9I9_9EURY|nr:ABC transporter substrate-binding protein [Halosimplex carlsbadense]ELZ19946.1 family 5 extracellular solute-binding protein [Halosimplex carlsbadense 2-9-1]
MVNSTSDGSDDDSSASEGGVTVNRRRLLAAAGMTAVGGLAGCSDGGSVDGTSDGGDGGDGSSDGGGGGGDTSTSSGGMQDTDQTFRWFRTDADLSAMQMSPLHPKWSYTLRYPFHACLFEPSTTHSTIVTEGMDCESIEFDADAGTYTFNIRDNVYWHRGSEILGELTSEDLKLQWDMRHSEKLLGLRAPQVESVETPDDKTLVFNIGDAHSQNIELFPPGQPFAYIYRDGELASMWEDLQSASGDEAESIKEDIINHSKPTDGTAISAGAWYIDNASPQRLDLRRVEGHWLAESEEMNNNWNRAQVIKATGAGNAMQQGLEQDRIDYANDGYPASRGLDSIPDGITARVQSRQQGRGFMINYAGEINDLMKVEGDTASQSIAKLRQGFAHAVDGMQIFKNFRGERLAEQVGTLEKTTFGEASLIQEYYPDLWEALPDYGSSHQPEKAKAAFRAGGLSQDGDTWVKPNGEPFAPTIQVPNTETVFGVTMRDNLRAVGVQAEVSSESETKFINDLFNNGYSICHNYVYTGMVPPDLESAEMLSSYGNSWAWKRHNPPGKYEIPEIGDMTGDVVETFNADTAQETIQTSGMDDSEERATLGKKAIWAASYHLPGIPLLPGVSIDRFNTANFEWPGPNETLYTATEDSPVSMGVRGRHAIRGFKGQYVPTDQ